LDRILFQRLPHPWLVVDDAHANLNNLIPFIAGFMHPRDFYPIEDSFANLMAAVLGPSFRCGIPCGFRSTPNGWLVKQ